MYINEIRRQAFYDLRAKGYSPIPMSRGAVRKPCIRGWTEYSTRQATDDEIEYWLRTFPECNVSIALGYGDVVAVDIDANDMVAPLAAVLPAQTMGKFGSKGLTVFYRSPDVKSRVMKANGRSVIEYLGAGSNTTVPPSIHDATGNAYRWVTDLRPARELPEIPADAKRRCYAALVRQYGAEACAGDPDQATAGPTTIDQPTRTGFADGRMRAYALAALDGEADKIASAPDGGRNRRVFDSCAALGKYVHHGVLSEDEVIERVLGACGSEGNGLLYDLLRGGGEAAIRASVASGFRKAASDALPDIGQLSAEEMFGPQSPSPGASPSPNPFVSLAAAAASPTIAVQWLHSNALPPEEPELIQGLHSARPGNVGAISGVSGSGKTFYAVHMALCVASGRPFLGRRMRYPEGAGVLFCAAEGEGTIHSRVYAARKALDIPDDAVLPLGLVTGFGNLLDDAERAAFVARVKAASAELEAAGRGPVRQLIIDTISAACRIESENDNSEAAAICKMLRTIALECNVSLEFLNHMGKNKERGMRGGSAWRDNIDSGVSLSDGELSILKSRNASEGTFGNYVIDSTILAGVLDQWGEPRNVGVFRFVTDPITDQRLDMDVCFDVVADGGNSAKIIDINAEFKRRCDGKPTANERQIKSRWLRSIENNSSKKYFMVNKTMIVRVTHENMNNLYGNSSTYDGRM